MIYQDIFGLELDHQILTGTVAESTELPNSNLPLSIHISPGQTEHLFSAQELLINLQGSGKLFLTDPLTATTSSERELIRLPPFTAAYVIAGNDGANYK
ncbi:hypothetical protein IMF27_11125 [Pseudomonas sp. PCH199]|uniref:hypothetical protein n=1 Tax=unclassified Pseudomonas TaxID=196821 RepID=UPI000FFBCA0F|nr:MULTISPECIES: hypothetical protein [unclassified Pseudomonas]MCW8276171.1 hypothetical protein [Pseudomonas sp. PCH199]